MNEALSEEGATPTAHKHFKTSFACVVLCCEACVIKVSAAMMRHKMSWAIKLEPAVRRWQGGEGFQTNEHFLFA